MKLESKHDIIEKLDNILDKTDSILKLVGKVKILTKLLKWLRRHKRKLRLVMEISFTLGGIIFSVLSILG
jgi:hypothetical protein